MIKITRLPFYFPFSKETAKRLAWVGVIRTKDGKTISENEFERLKRNWDLVVKTAREVERYREIIRELVRQLAGHFILRYIQALTLHTMLEGAPIFDGPLVRACRSVLFGLRVLKKNWEKGGYRLTYLLEKAMERGVLVPNRIYIAACIADQKGDIHAAQEVASYFASRLASLSS